MVVMDTVVLYWVKPVDATVADELFEQLVDRMYPDSDWDGGDSPPNCCLCTYNIDPEVIKEITDRLFELKIPYLTQTRASGDGGRPRLAWSTPGLGSGQTSQITDRPFDEDDSFETMFLDLVLNYEPRPNVTLEQLSDTFA